MLNLKLFNRFVLIFILFLTTTVASAAQLTATIPGQDIIEDLTKSKSYIVIGDQQYKLKLNTKITNSKRRVLNRYALKIGQSILFKPSIQNSQLFIDSIVIVSD